MEAPLTHSLTLRAGDVVAVEPVEEGVPERVTKQTYLGGTLATSMVVSSQMAWENIFMVEVVRSCPEMCRFCLASYLTLPFRTAPVDGALIPAIRNGLKHTDRIGLLGASVTQHPEFDKLLEFMSRVLILLPTTLNPEFFTKRMDSKSQPSM